MYICALLHLLTIMVAVDHGHAVIRMLKYNHSKLENRERQTPKLKLQKIKYFIALHMLTHGASLLIVVGRGHCRDTHVVHVEILSV